MSPRPPGSRWRKALLATAVIAGAFVVFATWYRIHYSMGVAQPFEVNHPSAPLKVLLATQGSQFKDAVVSGVVEHLRERAAYVKVIDVSSLPGVQEDEWSAIVILHTWEMRKPQPDAQAFVGRARNLRKVVVLSTSGAGDFKIDGIDAISSASRMTDVAARVSEISARVDAVLDAGAAP